MSERKSARTPKPNKVRKRREIIQTNFKTPLPPVSEIKAVKPPSLIVPEPLILPEPVSLILPETVSKGPIIIDKISAPASKFVFKPHPLQKDFKTTVAWQNYWDIEKTRWIEGYGGLNGHHYMYLSQWKMKMGTEQVIGPPWWREDDEYIFNEIEEAERLRQELLWLSRREYGKTSILSYECWRASRLYPNSTQLITSSDKTKIFQTFTSKIVDILKHLHPEIAPKVVNINKTTQSMLLTSSYPLKDGSVTEGRMWGLETNETPRSPYNLSSHRAKIVVIDEIGLHNRIDDLLGSARPTLQTNGVRDGLLFMAGTVEYGIPADSLKKLSEIVKFGQDTDKIRVAFTPYYHGMYTTNGRSDYKRAIREWEKECEILEKSGNRVALMTYVKNNPPDIETALGIGGGSKLPEHITAKLFEHSKNLLRNKPPVHSFTLTIDTQARNGITATLSKLGGKGTVVILEHPQDGVIYRSSIDPIPGNSTVLKDEKKDKRSKHAIIIYKGITHLPVAYFMERSEDMDYLVEKSVMLQKYYNNSKALLETNAGALLKDRYIRSGYKDLLSDTPKKLKIKLAKQIADKGYFKDDQVGDFQHTLLIDWLDKYWEHIQFTQLLTDLGLYLLDNTDLLDAFLGILLEEEEQVRRLKDLPVAKPLTRQKRIPYYDSHGRLSFKWVEVRA